MPSLQETFGLRFNPFSLKEGSLETKFLTDGLTQAHLRMKRTAKEGGICLLTGSSGKGVSFAANCAVAELENSGINVKYMIVNHVSVRDFYKALCQATDTEPFGKTRGTLFDSICATLNQLQSQGRPLFLILDNAQNIPREVFLDLPQLLWSNHPPRLGMSISLCGTEGVGSILRANESLRALVCDFYTMPGLLPKEIDGYVRHKIRLAGGDDTVLTEDAVRLLRSYSTDGNYYVVNKLMQDAIYIAAMKGHRQIDADVIRSSAAHQF